MAAKASTKTAAKPATKSASKTASARKTTKAKTAPKTASKAAAKPEAKTKAPPLPKTVAAKQPLTLVKDDASGAGRELKKRELLDLVVKRSDVKKKFAKPVMEAMIEVLGEALAEERAINLQPMGRIMPKRTKEAGSNRVITARIRQSKTAANTGAVDRDANDHIVENTPVAKPAE